MFKCSLLVALCFVGSFAVTLRAQAPVIESGGVQNAASNISLSNLVPQMLVTIRGYNLAGSTEVASAVPLPFTLGGASVYFNGQPAPMLYASPTQIDVQAPYATNQFNNSVVVSTVAGASQPYSLNTTDSFSFGIFTQNSSGCGQALAYNVHADGSVSLNTPQNSLDPTKDAGLTLFLTGMGGFIDRLEGVPWTYNPVDNLALGGYRFGTYFGTPGVTSVQPELTAQYAGPAPDTVGVDQINALGQWTGAPFGCRVPMFVWLGLGPSSQSVDISIQPGGGMCTDTTGGTLGIIDWQQTTVSQAGAVSKSASITAQFIQADGLGFAPPGPIPSAVAQLGSVSYDIAPDPPAACPASLPITLEAGNLELTGPGIGSVILPPSIQDGRETYAATPPGGAIPGGGYQVQGLGGSDVGPFTAFGHIPAPITVTTKLAPGSTVSYGVTWTGGTDESAVTLQIVVNGSLTVSTSALATAGSIAIPPRSFCFPAMSGGVPPLPCEGLSPGASVEEIVTQTPASPLLRPFNAPGLGLGGELTWSFVFDYRGLTS